MPAPPPPPVILVCAGVLFLCPRFLIWMLFDSFLGSAGCGGADPGVLRILLESVSR